MSKRPFGSARRCTNVVIVPGRVYPPVVRTVAYADRSAAGAVARLAGGCGAAGRPRPPRRRRRPALGGATGRCPLAVALHRGRHRVRRLDRRGPAVVARRRRPAVLGVGGGVPGGPRTPRRPAGVQTAVRRVRPRVRDRRRGRRVVDRVPRRGDSRVPRVDHRAGRLPPAPDRVEPVRRRRPRYRHAPAVRPRKGRGRVAANPFADGLAANARRRALAAGRRRLPRAPGVLRRPGRRRARPGVPGSGPAGSRRRPRRPGRGRRPALRPRTTALRRDRERDAERQGRGPRHLGGRRRVRVRHPALDDVPLRRRRPRRRPGDGRPARGLELPRRLRPPGGERALRALGLAPGTRPAAGVPRLLGRPADLLRRPVPAGRADRPADGGVPRRDVVRRARGRPSPSRGRCSSSCCSGPSRGRSGGHDGRPTARTSP